MLFLVSFFSVVVYILHDYDDKRLVLSVLHFFLCPLCCTVLFCYNFRLTCPSFYVSLIVCILLNNCFTPLPYVQILSHLKLLYCRRMRAALLCLLQTKNCSGTCVHWNFLCIKLIAIPFVWKSGRVYSQLLTRTFQSVGIWCVGIWQSAPLLPPCVLHIFQAIRVSANIGFSTDRLSLPSEQFSSGIGCLPQGIGLSVTCINSSCVSWMHMSCILIWNGVCIWASWFMRNSGWVWRANRPAIPLYAALQNKNYWGHLILLSVLNAGSVPSDSHLHWPIPLSA